MSIAKCPKCDGVISLRFPIHVCKSVLVIDGDNQKRIKKITLEEREAEVQRLNHIYDDVGVDVNGDIVFYKEI